MVLSELNPIVKMFLSIPIVIRMFILPFMAASFMIKTSDVGAIISSMDKLKISKNVSIPIAVMFRFFPSLRRRRKHQNGYESKRINFKTQSNILNMFLCHYSLYHLIYQMTLQKRQKQRQ